MSLPAPRLTPDVILSSNLKSTALNVNRSPNFAGGRGSPLFLILQHENLHLTQKSERCILLTRKCLDTGDSEKTSEQFMTSEDVILLHLIPFR